MKMIHSSDQELVREQGCGAAAVEVPENGVANEGQNNLRVEVPQDVPRIQEWPQIWERPQSQEQPQNVVFNARHEAVVNEYVQWIFERELVQAQWKLAEAGRNAARAAVEAMDRWHRHLLLMHEIE